MCICATSIVYCHFKYILEPLGTDFKASVQFDFDNRILHIATKMGKPKGTHDNPKRNPLKRKFVGNRHTFEKSTANTSTAAEKLLHSEDDEIIIDQTHKYCFIEFFSVFSAISALVVCKICQKHIIFNQSSTRGLGFRIAMSCECGIAYVNSGPMIENAYEINRRIVFVMRLLGIGINGLNLFCGLMDLATKFHNNTFEGCFQNVMNAAESIYKWSTKKAIAKEKAKTLQEDGSDDCLTVSGDGTWKKRGHTSRFGVTTLAGKYSKKIIDSVVKSTYCKSCEQWEKKKSTHPEEYEEWYEGHDDCDINHIGSAGKMEVDSVKEMFGRSIEEYGVKYTRYIGDGDSATYKGLLDLNPYDVEVQKLECYLHVKKRMGTRCRNLKKQIKNLGGRSKNTKKLTDQVINKLQKYYGLAITRHQDNVDEMYKEIWATFYHLSSTDENPNHENCPVGENSWCSYRRAEAQGMDLSKFKHDYLPLDKDVTKALEPIYTDLSSKELLQRCKGGNTQNNNESYNGLLWHFAPKHLHSGVKTVELANFLSVSIFNDGFHGILKMLGVMGVVIGPIAEEYAVQRDDGRIKQAEIRHAASTKEGRTARRQSLASQQAFFEKEEGVLYGPGIAD